jgi:hypothetical protein
MLDDLMRFGKNYEEYETLNADRLGIYPHGTKGGWLL